MGPYIGIDLGTSACCIAHYSDGVAEVICDEDNDHCPTVPSYVAFVDNRQLVGEQARAQANENVGNTIFDAKRFIGRKFEDPDIEKIKESCTFEVVERKNNPKFRVICFKEEKLLSPEQISAMILNKLKRLAERKLQQSVNEVVITVPAYFNGEQREATLSAAQLAELRVLRLIHEPTAAILAYGLDQKFELEDKKILVYDLGAGTFDLTIVRCKNEVFQVVYSNGDSALGGRDFDTNLAKYLEPEVKKNCGSGLGESREARHKLIEACKLAKHSLSGGISTEIDVKKLINGNDFKVTLTRARFEALNENLFNKTIQYVDDALSEAKLSVDEISFVLLVGGSTKIPKIRELLMNKFPDVSRLMYTGDPDQIVARGAAIQAAMIKKSAELMSVTLADVCPLSLGVGIKDGLMSVLIPRNSRIPCEVKKEYRTVVDNQRAITCRVYEGERQFVRYTNELGQFVLDGIEQAPKGKYAYDVTLKLDANGILTVTEVERHTGKKAEMEIAQARERYSQRDLQAMINDMERFREKDRLERERIDLKQEFELYLEELACNATGNAEVCKIVDEEQQWLKINGESSQEQLKTRFEAFKSKNPWRMLGQN